MDVARRHRGLTLVEMLVVMTIMTLLFAAGVPAVDALRKSFESPQAAKAMIAATLGAARSIAMLRGTYAGVRFQQEADPCDPKNAPLYASQYMILIVHDAQETGLAFGFRAVEGAKPVKLPDSIGAMDMWVVDDRLRTSPGSTTERRLDDGSIDVDALDAEFYFDLSGHLLTLREVTTFSVIFSPTGHIVRHTVVVRNRMGKPDTTVTAVFDDTIQDDVFNIQANVDAGLGRFYQDDYFDSSTQNLRLGPEKSRDGFILYAREPFRKALLNGRAWTEYLAKGQTPIYVNPYSGVLFTGGTP